MRRLLVIVLLCTACVEPYTPKLSGDFSALVVDGSIDIDGSAIVKLSRGVSLGSKQSSPKEPGATVTIESSGGEIFSLPETSPGTYSTEGLAVDKSSTYELHIVTSSNNEYRSDKMTIHSTPPIDSIYWQISGADQLQIKIDTHDNDPNSTGYYTAYGVETYEYHAPVYCHYTLRNHILTEQDVFVCYRDERTLNTIASTNGQTKNRVSGMTISTIDRTSDKISVRYSILAKLRTIGQEEYEFQKRLIASNEQTGSLFSQVPGTVLSNVHSVTDPDEYVLGYFRAQEIKELRFFIDPYQNSLPAGFYEWQFSGCEAEESCGGKNPPGGCISPSALGDGVGILAVLGDDINNPAGYLWVKAECGNCLLRGDNGTTTKPSFW